MMKDLICLCHICGKKILDRAQLCQTTSGVTHRTCHKAALEKLKRKD